MLEKRNKSRLSLRKVFLFFDYSLEDYMAICKDLLSLPTSFKDRRFLKRWKTHVEACNIVALNAYLSFCCCAEAVSRSSC